MREIYLTSTIRGTLLIESNSKVVVGKNMTVFASVESSDYYEDDSLFLDTCNNEFGRGLFFARDKENIEICAESNGIINGQGFLWRKSPVREKRPFLIRLVGCKNVKLKNLNLVDAACYAVSLHDCENVNILSKWGYHDDGIGVSCCRAVRIKNCTINCGGDAIGLKSVEPILMRDVTIERCRIKTNSDGIKIGIEKGGDVENIRMRDCIFEKAATAIKIVPSGHVRVENVVFENLIFGDTQTGAFVLTRKAEIAGLRFSDLKTYRTPSENGADCKLLLIGNKRKRIESVIVENCDLTVAGGGKAEADMRVGNWNVTHPEPSLLGELPAYGMYACYVDGLTVKNVRFQPRVADERDAFSFQSVTGKTED